MTVDPNIQKKANDIRTKTYGKEVRESLASGLEEMSKDIEETKGRQDSVEAQFQSVIEETRGKDVISAPEISAALVSHTGTRYNNLKERLDKEHQEVTSQLAQIEWQKADFSYVDYKVQQVASGAPKIVASTLSELEELYPLGSEHNALVTDDGHIYAWIDSEWNDTGIVYQAVGIAPKSISEREITFAQKGKNLFDGTYVRGLIITGNPTEGGEVAERTGGVSVIQKLEPGKTYTITRSDDVDRFATAVFKEYPQIEGVLTQGGRYISANHSATQRTFTLEEDEKYVMVYLSSPNQDKIPDFFQIELGDKASEYEPPNYVKVNLTENSITGYQLAPRSVEPHHLNFDIENGIYVNIERFGADVNNTDNKQAIQDAIDYAANLVNVATGVVRVFVPEGTYIVNGTLYGRSRVELVGNGRIKASDNANFDYVEWGGIARPTGAHTLYAIVGADSNPIKYSGVRGVTFDFNGKNQEVEPGGSYIGVAISQAEDCWAYETTSENVMYEKTEVIENDDKVRSLCLFVAHAKRTKIIGGRYWKAGYDSIRIAGGAEDTSLINVFAGKAKRGAIQFTPDSNIVHLSNCIFDNREGGHSTSHAFFAHNLQNVYADNLTLKAKDGYCIAIFSDGNPSRGAQSKFANLKNVVLENDEERFISLTSLSDEYWTKGIGIQGIALTSKKQTPLSGHVPVYVNRCEGIDINLEIPEISMNPISLQHVKNVKVRLDLETEHSIYTVVGLSGNLGVKNVTFHDSVINAPNAQRTLNSNGTSDNVKIVNVTANTLDSVSFLANDENILLRDCDFREVGSTDKLRLISTNSVVIDNVLGV